MKKTLILVLMCIVPGVLVSAAGAEEVASDLPYIEMTKVFYYVDATEHLDRKAAFMEKFEQEFGVRLKVNTFPRNEYMEKLNLSITSGQLGGFVLPFTPGDAKRYKEDGAILPLDGMLAGNGTWYAQNDEFRNLFEWDGQIWGFGTGFTPVMFQRFARKDWLDNLGMDVPTNLTELAEMARAFTEDDPDGNGVDDTVGLVTAGTWNIQDIFASHGARLNGWGGDSITWDENEQAYVDSFLKPEAAEALQYLADLYQKGYIDQEAFVNNSSALRSKLWSGKYGSSYYWQHWGTRAWLPTLVTNVPDAEMTLVPTLDGNITENINFVHGSTGGPWVLLANTKDASKMANTFVNTFFGDDDAYLWACYGVLGEDWRMEDGRILQYIDPATGLANVSPGLTIGRKWGWPTDYLINVPDGEPDVIKETVYWMDVEAKAKAEGLANGKLYILTPAKDDFGSVTYTEIMGDVRKIFDETVVKSITGEMSPQEALEAYRRQVKALGAQAIIDECNASAGTTAPEWAKY